MNLRLILLTMADQQAIDPVRRRRLMALAGLQAEPSTLQRHLPRVLALLASALVAFGVVMWIAANWGTFGRMGRFALLMAWVDVTGAGAAWRPGARVPFGLMALFGIGALFAYFGQTYQTGADRWQLFAWWAVLALPLCLGVRSDVLWVPWATVSATAVSLWAYANLRVGWQLQYTYPADYAAVCATVLVLAGGLSSPLRRYTGAGVWSFRTAATWAVMIITLLAVFALFNGAMSYLPIGLAMLAAAAGLLCLRKAFDVFALSAVALGVNVLAWAGILQ